MNTDWLSIILLLSSIEQIAAASAAIGIYNAASLDKDNKYTLSVIYLILGCVGVLLALWAIIYKDYVDNSIIFVGLVYVWLVVNIATCSVSGQVITNQQTGYMISYILAGLFVLLALYFTFISA